jgi:hypothetical protein
MTGWQLLMHVQDDFTLRSGPRFAQNVRTWIRESNPGQGQRGALKTPPTAVTSWQLLLPLLLLLIGASNAVVTAMMHLCC